MRVLVTGATGFIGSHLVKRLVSEHHQVSIYCRNGSDTRRLMPIVDQLRIVTGEADLRSYLIAGSVDLVIHLAAYYFRGSPDIEQKKLLTEANITFPKKLTLWSIEGGVKGMITTGTCFEFAMSTKCITEISRIEPLNDYAKMKVEFDDWLKDVAKRNMFKTINLKLSYVYGEGDNDKVIPKLITSGVSGSSLILSDGRQRLNFTYVGDVVNAYVLAVNYLFSSRNILYYDDFLIGNQMVYSIRYLRRVIQKLLKKKVIVSWGAPYDRDVRYMSFCYKKAQHILGWRPSTSLELGLTKTINYYISL